MSNRKHTVTVAALGLAVIVLVVAATNPAATYDVITTPAEMLRERAREQRRAEAHRGWAVAYEQAMAGEPKAMYKVGRVLQGQTWAYGTGLDTNPRLGDSLVDAAAQAGYPAAEYHVWSEERGSLEELLPLFRRVVAEGYTDSLDMSLVFIASSVGVEAHFACDRDLWYESWEARIAHWETRAQDAPLLRRQQAKREQQKEREKLEAYFASGCTLYEGAPVKPLGPRPD